MDSKFLNQGSGTIQSQQRAKGGRTRLPANEATFRYKSSFINYFGGTPYTYCLSLNKMAIYWYSYSPSFYSFSFLRFSFFPFPSFLSFPLFLPSLFSFCQHKQFSGTNGPMVRYIFHPCKGPSRSFVLLYTCVCVYSSTKAL